MTRESVPKSLLEQPTEGGDSRLVGWLLLVPYPLSALLVGTVHEPVRAMMALICVLVGLYAVLRTPSRSAPMPVVLVAAAPAVLAVLLGALALIPVGSGVRAILQPGLAPVIDPLLELGGSQRHPLAVDPRGAIGAWGFSASLVVLAAGVAVAVRHRRRSLRLATSIVLTGVGLVVLAAAQRLTGAEHVLWVTDSPSGPVRDHFFGSFVNPNHAGIALAAALPLSLSLALRPRMEWRVIGILAALVLAAGAIWTGSRGALLEMGVAVAVVIAVASGRTLRLVVLGGAVVALATVVVGGFRDVAIVLSEVFMPGSVAQDAFGLRTAIWADGARLLEAAPLVGAGPGGFEDAYKVVKTMPRFTATAHAHQDLLQAMVEHGMLMGLLWLGAVVAPVGLGLGRALRLPPGRRRSLAAGWLGCSAALLTASLYDFPFHIGALAILYALSAGVHVAAAARDDASVVGAGRRAAFRVAMALVSLVGLLPLGVLAKDRLSPGWAWAPNDPLHEAADRHWEEAREAARAAADPASALQASETAARQALAHRPLDHVAALALARARFGAEDHATAIAIAEAAGRAYPTLPATFLLQARIHRHAGQHAEARAAWKRALELNLPDNDKAIDHIERALAEERDPAAVVDEIIPERADRLRDAAVLLARREEQATATALFERAFALDPAMGLAYGTWLLRWGNAERAFEVVSEVPDESCRSLMVGADALARLGRAKEAEGWYGRALARCSEKDEAEARLGLARARATGGDREAMKLLQAEVEARPQDHALRRELILALRRAGRFEEMVPHIEVLVLAGEATEQEMADLSRIYDGLPPR